MPQGQGRNLSSPRLRTQGQGLNITRPTCNVNIWRSKMTMITNFMYLTAKQTYCMTLGTHFAYPGWVDLLNKHTTWRYTEYVKFQTYHLSEYMSRLLNFEKFKWHFIINTWQKPMTQEVCPTFLHTLRKRTEHSNKQRKARNRSDGQ